MSFCLCGESPSGYYLAPTYVYTPQPRNGARALFVLLDGPAWAGLSLLLKYERPLAFAVFIIVFIVAWLASLVAGNVLHEVSRRP